MRRRTVTALLALAIPAPALVRIQSARAASAVQATLYKNPQCTCCESYAQYLEQSGFQLEIKPTNDLAEISRKAGIPDALEGCHTMFLGGYVIGGHVPVEIIRKLLAEMPPIAGITLPGMPSGSPGMNGPKAETWTIYAVMKDGKPPEVFAVV